MTVNTFGKIIRTRKAKRGDLHNKNHKWESFTSKISKLNTLNPIRRARRQDVEDENISTTSSYLKKGLEKWIELNMSDGFVAFYHDVKPMCDSLPQIIHFEEKIISKFIYYIEKEEIECLEPLLELITDFAHDLSHLFEKHYPKVLGMITSLVEKPQDVSVIEWCFTSLTFIFKYLSRLLVPDLRPTYNLMAPLLGKHRQRPHIARFAAESLSFLIKKTGSPVYRNNALNLITNHAKHDLLRLKDSRENTLYNHGLMILFAEAIKGQGTTVHTSGPSIFKSLLRSLDDKDRNLDDLHLWKNVIFGVLISLLHHTTSDTSESIIEEVIEFANRSKNLDKQQDIHSLQLALISCQMIGICCGVRKGSRIKNWSETLEALSNILKFVSINFNTVVKFKADLDIWNSLILFAAIILHYAPSDSIVPYLPLLMDILSKEPLGNYFLTLCSFLLEIGPERFEVTAMPYFQRFVESHWSDITNKDILSILLPKLSKSRLSSSSLSNDKFPLPISWQDEIIRKFEQLEFLLFPDQAPFEVCEPNVAIAQDQFFTECNSLLEVLESTKVQISTREKISETLLRMLKLALKPSLTLSPKEVNFIMGRCFGTLLKIMVKESILDCALEPLLLAAAPGYIRLPQFLSALLNYKIKLKDMRISSFEQTIEKTKSQWNDTITISLVHNLSTDSQNLKLLSLQILEQIYGDENCMVPEALSIMLMIEQTPIDLQTVRSVSMLLRKLGSLYPGLDHNSWLCHAIPAFCFGLKTAKFSQIWEDATTTLKTIAQTKNGEKIISQIIISWLEISSVRRSDFDNNFESHKHLVPTDFECSNLTELIEIGKQTESSILSIRDEMQKKFSDIQEMVSPHPTNARSQALHVLATAPFIAEKHSRQIVPLFLSCSRKVFEISDQLEDDEDTFSSDWIRSERKLLLSIFSNFTNPKSLYKSEEVHAALLTLLENGDINIQRSALKAIFTWKNPSINPYQENLLNLLDEARFKEELGYIIDSQIFKAEHRSTLMPVLLRILYGRSMCRKNGQQSMEARRKLIFRTLDIEDIEKFLDISLGSLRDLCSVNEDKFKESILRIVEISPRKLLGITHMIEDVLKELGTQILPFTEKLVNAILYCLIFSTRQLRNNHEERARLDEAKSTPISSLKAIRHIGMRCLVLLFSNSPKFNWVPYLSTINSEILSERLVKLPEETAQSISVILKLFSIWSNNSELVPLFGINNKILSKISECLVIKNSKDEVKIFVLNIIRRLAKYARESKENSNEKSSFALNLLTSNMNILLIRINLVMKNHQDLGKEFLESCIEATSELSNFVSTITEARELLEISVSLLEQPPRRVSPRTKGRVLIMLKDLLSLYKINDDPDLKEKVYRAVSSLFSYFKDKESRELLSQILCIFSKNDTILLDIATICEHLNSFKKGQLDEPDYERRLMAFNMIQNQQKTPFTAHQWTPILYNLLFYIKHDEEFGVLSSNSSDGICQLISEAGNVTEHSEKADFERLFSKIILPALFSGVRELSEIIRRECLKVMAQLIRVFSTWPEISDMHNLLAGDNEIETSFFNNILALGKGRQSSALAQLSASAEKGMISSRNASQFFIPLIEHFVFNHSGVNEAHSLAAEATSTISVLSTSLKWHQYRATIKRLIRYLKQKPESEKQVIRLLSKIIDHLTPVSNSYDKTKNNANAVSRDRSMLMATVPERQKITEDITTYFLPQLMNYLHDKDESKVSLRASVAIIVVKLLKILPQEQLNQKLPAVLTDVCHILRSKAQESRDIARGVLSEISILLGPLCFGFILKELRGALHRGSQLHVLSYTMHSLLVAAIPTYSSGDLDYCIPMIVAIIMDDVFGDTGQEKDAEDYSSKLKEVKSSKSHDSMELIAKTVSISHLKDLIQPCHALLKEKLTIRIIRKIEELLYRITNGLMMNPAASSSDVLVFCYQIIQESYKNENSHDKSKENHRFQRFLLQKAAKKSGDRGSTAIFSYKIVNFAFNILRLVLKKHSFLRTPAYLIDFIPILGDAIVRAEDEIKATVFKLLVTIIKVPPNKEYDCLNLYRVALDEAIKTILMNCSTFPEVSQAALKFMSAILRDRKDVLVKETSIDSVLLKMKDEIIQFDHRNIVFNFLRAILDAGVQTAVVYDTLDYIGTVMVTDNDKETRNLSRGAYFQFLRDYPQKKNRWSKQLSFIIANLKYEHEGGRLSILEVIHLLLSKSESVFVQEVSATMFIPLVFVLANDKSEKCRILAGELLKTIFAKAEMERVRNFLSLLRSWLKKDDNSLVIRLAFQTFGFYFESENSNENDLHLVSEAIMNTMQKTIDQNLDWEEIYFALQLVPILISKFPRIYLSSKLKSFWQILPRILSYPHTSVKLSALKLISIYLTDFVCSNIKNDLQGLPLKGSNDLFLASDDIIILVQSIFKVLEISELAQVLADEAVRNLVFLARIASVNDIKMIHIRLNDLNNHSPTASDESNDDVIDEDIDDAAVSEKQYQRVHETSVLGFFFKRISYILRRESVPPRLPALVTKVSSLELLRILTNLASDNSIVPYLLNILLPLSNLTDPNIPIPYSTDEAFRREYGNLRANSEEILESLKKKIGTHIYSKKLLEVRDKVKQRRMERSVKRKVEAINEPERHGEKKRKKLEKKKDRRKEKDAQHKKRRNEF